MKGRQEEAREAWTRIRELNPDYLASLTSLFNDEALAERLREGMHSAGVKTKP